MRFVRRFGNWKARRLRATRGTIRTIVCKRIMNEKHSKKRMQKIWRKKKRLESAISYRKDMAGSMDAKQEKLFKKGLTRKEVAYGRMFKGGQQKSQHKTIKATEKRLERLEHVDKPFQFKPVKIRLPETRRLKKGTSLLQISAGDVKVPGKKLFKTEAFSIKVGEKIALVGKNASGKTSFLRAILNEDDLIRRTNEVRIAYFDQELAGLVTSETLIENVNRVNAHDKQLAMDVLGSMHFSQADLNKKSGDSIWR